MANRDFGALVGCEVRRVCLDYQVTLTLVDGPYQQERVNAGLQIEAPFTYKAEDGVSYEIEPGEVTTLGPVVNLFKLTVQAANFDGRTLTIDFENGARIEVATLSHYESWNLTGAGVPGYIAGPWDLEG
jgi:hypothetical protein